MGSYFKIPLTSPFGCRRGKILFDASLFVKCYPPSVFIEVDGWCKSS